jgi:hypothetical protein
MDDRDINIIDAAIEEIRAQKQRRIDERVENGEIVRVPFGPVVVGTPEAAAETINRAKAHKIAELRAAGETREIVFGAPPLMEGETEPISVIVTGVPRAGRDPSYSSDVWRPQDNPIPTGPKSSAEQMMPASEPYGVRTSDEPQWKSIQVQVVAPDAHLGTVIEAEYAEVGSELQVRYQSEVYVEMIKPGDDPLAAARQLVRAKWDKHGAFHDPIRYPPRGYH